MKLIVDKSTDRVIGLHMVGPDAGEICQGMAVAMKAGATKAYFDSTVGIHPTAAEEFVTMRTPAHDGLGLVEIVVLIVAGFGAGLVPPRQVAAQSRPCLS